MDVWFDSGSSHVAVLEEHPDLNWPADMYLEGSDQHRGWFQSSLLTAVATRGSAPYRSVLTHGFVVDGEGRKMSKSLGNVVVPEDVIKDYGADILRLWVASTDYTGDVRVSPEILRQLAEVYRKIRNTLRYLLGNLADFDPARDAIEYNELQELDRWALYTTGKMLKRVQRSFDEYQYHIVYHTIHNYCVNDMSSFYLDVLKDRLYTEGRNSKERRSAQTVLWEIASVLVRIIAPILPHTAEEVWGLMPRKSGDPESVHLTDWPQPPTEWNDEQLGQRWEDVLRVRDALSKALEQERKEHRIQGSLQAEVQLFLPEQLRQVLVSLTEPLEQLFLVASVELLDEVAEDMQEVGASIWVRITPTEVEKCERCWRHDKTVGRHDDHPTLCSRCHGVIQRDFVQ